MVPAHQHLGAHTAPHVVHLGLQIGLQLAGRNGAAQVLFDAKALAHGLGHVGLEDDDLAQPGLLGLVQGHARAAQHIVATAVGARGGKAGRANAAAGLHFLAGFLQPQRPLQRVLQHLGQGAHVLIDLGRLLAGLLQQHGEFVGAHAGQQHAVGQGIGQAQRQRAQQRIATHRAAHIVEGREAVHVQQQQAVARLAALAALAEFTRQRAQALGQRQAVGQAGERVEMRQRMDLAFCAHALGQVLLELHIVDDAAVRGAYGRHQHGLGQVLALARAVGHLAAPQRAPAQLVQGLFPGRRVQAHGGVAVRGLAQDLVARKAGALQEGLVHVDDVLVHVGDDDAFGVLLHGAVELAQIVLVLLQRAQRVLQFLGTADQAAPCHQRDRARQPQHAHEVQHGEHGRGLALAYPVNPLAARHPERGHGQHGQHQHGQRGAHAQHPGAHDEQGRKGQHRAALHAARGSHHGHGCHPGAPDQKIGGQLPVPAPAQQHGAEAHAGGNQVQPHAGPGNGVLRQKRHGQEHGEAGDP